MDKEDIEQELMLDLLRRKGRFDPDRASFDTFADRVITNRVASLTASTHKLRAERITNPTACSRAASGPADVCLTNPGPFDETRRPSK